VKVERREVLRAVEEKVLGHVMNPLEGEILS